MKNKCADPEDETPVDALPGFNDPESAKAYFSSFLEDYLGEVMPGRVPDLSAVYGAVSTAPPKPKPVKTQTTTATSKKKPADKSKPVPEAKRLQAGDVDLNVDPTVKRTRDLLDVVVEFYTFAKQPVDLISILIDRESFQKSVQNFFCFSFLLKDNFVRMYLDENKLPVCTPLKIPKRREGNNSQNELEEDEEMIMEDVPDPVLLSENKYQTVMMNLTHADWKAIVEAKYPGTQNIES